MNTFLSLMELLLVGKNCTLWPKCSMKVAQATVSSLQVCMNEPFRISHVHLSHHILYPGHWETGDVKVSQLSLPKIYFFQR